MPVKKRSSGVHYNECLVYHISRGPIQIGLYCYLSASFVAEGQFLKKQDAQLSQRDRAAGCVIVFAKSRTLEMGANDLRTL